jgi:hypothetical protein
MIAGRINVALIRAHWLEILRIVASIRTGTVTASLIMRQLASYPRQNGVAAALRELGRLERTLFTLDWVNDPELRRTTGRELNKGESRNSLARPCSSIGWAKSATVPMRTSSIAFRPQSSGHCHHSLEYAVSGARRDRSAQGRGCPRSSAGSSVPARLGARQPDRRLRLGRRRTDGGKR